MGGRQEAMVKIACIQMEPVVGERDRNLQKSLAMIEQAASEGARLIVLPELCNSGYVFESRDEAFELVGAGAGRPEPVAPGARRPRATACTSWPGSASGLATCSTTARW